MTNVSKAAMGKNVKRTQPGQPAVTSPSRTVAAVRPPLAVMVIGALLLFVSASASGMLVWSKISGMALPGCAVDSPCQKLASSAWGKVPGIGWPVSYVGFAYFAAMLVGWTLRPSTIGNAYRNVARLGALASIMFFIVMFQAGYVCQYCVAAHAGNLAFVLLLEFTRLSAKTILPSAATVGVSFALLTGGLLGVERWQAARVNAKAEGELSGSVQQIIQQSQEQKGGGGGTEAPRKVFNGRYRYGPDQAAIRIVMWMGYQCPDCQRVEREVQDLLKERQDVSLSVKHFPMNSDCNKYFKEQHHGNACWSARAAEAAGILGGNDGFWRMHHWLLSVDGRFETSADLRAGVESCGLDSTSFEAVMKSPETLKRVQEDIEEAVDYGLHYTPFIFINGVELRGWNAPNAVKRAVEQVLKSNPTPAGPENDRPPLAAGKFVGDWKENSAKKLAPETNAYPRGKADAKVRFTVFGDYQEDNTKRLDAAIKQLMATNPDTQYTFRQYPFDKSCNSNVPRTANPNACRMAAAAEAAGKLGGVDAVWKMHDWLLANEDKYSDDALRAAAGSLGLDAKALFDAIDSEEVKAAIQEDITAGQRAGLRGIPMLLINEKFVPRWQRNEKSLLDEFVKAAMNP